MISNSTVFFSRILEIALQAAARSSTVIKKFRENNSFSLTQKQARDFVTSADIESQKIIEETIRSYFPDHHILGEEDASLNKEISSATSLSGLPHLWILDPIDGTTNYMRGHHHVSISIAYAEYGETKVGVVEAPFLGESYRAIKNEGAFKNDKPLKCSNTNNLENCLVATGFPYNREFINLLCHRLEIIMSACQDIRRNGSAALDLCSVASGIVDAYYERDVKPWDIAAGLLIAKEAGSLSGQISLIPPSYQWCGAPDDLQGFDLLVSNPQLFDRIVDLIKYSETEK